MKKYDWQIEKLPEIVKNSVNFTEVLQELNIPRKGNNGKTLRNLLDNNGIDYSHFTGRARKYAKPNEKPVEEYLKQNSSIKPSVLKNKLIKAGLKREICECCNITEWNGKPLVMQLHHINGDSTDNRIENLQTLCPNCHSQTENYCGSANKPKQKYCPDCGKPINQKSTYCSMCFPKHRSHQQIPSLSELLESFKEIKSFTGVGEKYNVTDSAVRKWCKKYNVPSHSKDLLKYINTLQSNKSL